MLRSIKYDSKIKIDSLFQNLFWIITERIFWYDKKYKEENSFQLLRGLNKDIDILAVGHREINEILEDYTELKDEIFKELDKYVEGKIEQLIKE